MKRLALLVLLCAAPAFAQAGGPTAPPPHPDQIAANQVPSADTNFSAGTFAGYSYPNACATVTTANPFPGDTYSAQMTKCIGTNVTAFQFQPAVMHDHEAILVRWQAYASAGFVGTGVTAGFTDNTHGDGAVLWSYGRQNPVISGATGGWVQGFNEVFLNRAEHGADANIDVAFGLHSPAWPGANHQYVSFLDADGDEIVDSNGNVEKLTGCTSPCQVGTAAPAWNATTGGTTTDNEVTWTNEGANPPYYITHIEVEEEWFPLRAFLLYPDYRGYDWTDLAPVNKFLHGVNYCGTTIGEICGVTEIDPPAAQSLSTVTLTETLATSSNCSTGVLATDPFPSPSATQRWTFTPTVPAAGTVYYVCHKLTVTTGGALIDTYPSTQIVFENAAFRSANLNSWYEPSGQWMLDGKPDFLLGTYDRFSSARCAGCLYTTNTGYETGIPGFGFGLAPPASSSAGTMMNAKSQGNIFADYSQSHFTSVLSSFGTDSAISPTSASSYGDQLTPELAAFNDYGLSKWQILNNWMGYLVNEDGVSANPASPTVTATTGSITASYAFVEEVGAASPIMQGNSPERLPLLSMPSTATTIDLSTATCAGTNCGLTITPVCGSTSRWIGTIVYAATGSTSTPPANTGFFAQYPPSALAGQLSPADYIPCGSSFTLTTLFTAGPNPPAFDNTNNSSGRPGWAGIAPYSTATTDQTLWGLLIGTSAGADGMCYSPTPAASAGFYEYDETSLYAYGLGWEEYNYLRANCPQEPVSGVTIDDTTFRQFRDMADVIGADPYGYLVAPSPEEYVAGISTTATCPMYTVNNTVSTAANSCYPSRVDLWANALGRDTYGSRPSWMVIRQYGDSTYKGFTYQPMFRQIGGAILGCRVYGSLGCGVLSWGWVSVSGMENSWLSGDTLAWYDSNTAFGQWHSLIPWLEQPVEDSSQMNAITGTVSSGATVVGGVVVSGVTTSVATPTACNIKSGTTSIYDNTTLYPLGPVEFASQTDPATGDEYIFAANLCDSSFNVTFTLPKVPTGQTNVEALYEGRTLPISAGAFTDTWQPFDLHVYVIRSVRGAYIH